MEVILAALLLQVPPRSLPSVGDTAAVVVGTLLTVLVIYAILAARLRRTGGHG